MDNYSHKRYTISCIYEGIIIDKVMDRMWNKVRNEGTDRRSRIHNGLHPSLEKNPNTIWDQKARGFFLYVRLWIQLPKSKLNHLSYVPLYSLRPFAFYVFIYRYQWYVCSLSRACVCLCVWYARVHARLRVYVHACVCLRESELCYPTCWLMDLSFTYTRKRAATDSI